MKVENIINDKNFINYALKKVPNYMKAVISREDIESELNYVIMLCAQSFNPRRGSFMNFVIKSLKNNLYNIYTRDCEHKSREVPIEYAYGKTVEPNKQNHIELIAYFRTLPTELLEKLSDFALGKIKKEDIECPPLKMTSEEVNRIIAKIDSMV
jgi:hypothetical protein